MLEFDDREAGLLLNITGDGKGKTTSALGTAVRALGWGWRVAVLQFIKSERETGERRFFTRYFPEMRFEGCGLGLTCQAGDHAGFARAGWLEAVKLLREFDGELLILDELNVALSLHFLDVGEVVAALENRRKALNVIVTGRGAPPELLAASDLVSEIREIKHPYRKGIPARAGIDY